MNNEYIQLKWNAHASTFLENLSSLRDQQIYTDVTLSCGNQFYPAHRLVLSSCSSFFARALEVINEKTAVLLLHGIEQFILEHLLMFMYDGQVTIAQTDLPCFLQAARWLGMKGLDMPSNNPEGTTNGKPFQSELPSGPCESVRYFQIWTQLLSPLVNSPGGPPSYDDLTSALRQIVGRSENEEEESTIGGMIVSNVTSLSTQPEVRFSMDSEVIGNGLEPETVIKYENPYINMEEDVTAYVYSPPDPGGPDVSFLDSDDSSDSDSDNNFEGWENAEINVPNNLKNLQHQLSQNIIHDSAELSPAEHSPRCPTEEESGTDVQSKRKRSLRCKHCKNTFSVRQELAEHLRTQGHNFCYSCSKGFVSSKRYHLHMKSHEDGSLYCCNCCDFISRSKRGLSIHCAVMHDRPSVEEDNFGNRLVKEDSMFCCNGCDFVSHSKTGLSRHHAIVHGDLPAVEEEDHGNESTEQELIEKQSSVSLFLCSICGFSSNHVRGFKRHVTCMHSKKKWKELKVTQDDDRVMDSETSCSLYNCSMCDFSSTHSGGLKRHMTCKHLRPHLDDTLRPHLDDTLRPHLDDTLRPHLDDTLMAKENVEEGNDSSINKYYCNICHFTSIHKRGFRKHMSCMHDITEIPSDQNEMGYSDTDEDNPSRIVLRSDKKGHDCPQCKRSFENYRLFHKHKILGCGRYRCRFCQMRYRACERKEYLAHLKVHKETENFFKCTYCPYITDRKRSLSDHLSKHTGSYRFTCPWCPFKCVRNNVLQAHTHRIHGTQMNKQELENQQRCNNEDKFENHSFPLAVENNAIALNHDESERNESAPDHLNL